ncbi:hypothetical protein VQ042_07730 [Aurantimonas sp. A2-1-M11]|uniref:hypothetical protein n=1 Tax=Aurantimonas sp. A2-1-M11 TaxID=3113712 RepID=UPI002F95C218
MMGPAIIGALAGLVLGIVDFVILGYVRDSRARKRGGAADPAGLAFDVARYSQLVLFPVVGWFAAPIIASNLGG